MTEKFQAPRGTHDVLPNDAAWWHLVRTMEEVTALYGWRRIQTPGFEDTGLFARTAGEASDVVHKEMYNFADRSDRPLTLRPEGTAPICRAYVEHGMHREPQPVKAYTIAPMYRYGAPGRGRYREHYQLSVEAIGSEDPAIDAEIIQLYHELLRRLGVTKWELHLNSIGDANCRPQYVERLKGQLADLPAKLERMRRRFEKGRMGRTVKRPQAVEKLSQTARRELDRVEFLEPDRPARQEQRAQGGDRQPVGRPPRQDRILPQFLDEARSLAGGDEIGAALHHRIKPVVDIEADGFHVPD